MKRAIRMPLAEGKVRFVGDLVARVVAETYNRAKDAAKAVGSTSSHSVTCWCERSGEVGRAAALRRCAEQRVPRVPLGDPAKAADALATPYTLRRYAIRI